MTNISNPPVFELIEVGADPTVIVELTPFTEFKGMGLCDITASLCERVLRLEKEMRELRGEKNGN